MPTVLSGVLRELQSIVADYQMVIAISFVAAFQLEFHQPGPNLVDMYLLWNSGVVIVSRRSVRLKQAVEVEDVGFYHGC